MIRRILDLFNLRKLTKDYAIANAKKQWNKMEKERERESKANKRALDSVNEKRGWYK
jgi:hypothetical protein